MQVAWGAVCPSENEVLSLLRGTLPSSVAARLQAHIDECASCQEVLAIAMTRRSGARSVTKDERLDAGTIVGRYTVQEVVGAGAMGIVYVAKDRELNRKVALKILRAHDPDASARLHREAQALARIAHPNVIVVHEVGTFEDRLFMAMEFVDGKNLTQWLAERPSKDGIVDVFVQAGNGLAVAHAAGLVHRDFKPDNVLVGNDGRVRVVDFGLARPQAFVDEAEDSAEASGEHDVALTRTGDVMGTPAYMAPEQFRGAAADPRTDQYSYCVALNEAIHGRRALPRAGATGEFRVRRSLGFSPIDKVLARGLRDDPDRRFPTMNVLVASLRRPRRRGLALAIGVGLLGVLISLAALRATSERHLVNAPPTAEVVVAPAKADSREPPSPVVSVKPLTSAPTVQKPPARSNNLARPPRASEASPPTNVATPDRGGVVEKPPF